MKTNPREAAKQQTPSRPAAEGQPPAAVSWLRQCFGWLDRPWLRRAACVGGLGLLALSLLQFPSRTYDFTHDLGSQATYEYYAAHDFQFGTQVYQNVGPYGFVHYGDTYSGYLHAQKVVLKNLRRLTLFLLILWTFHRLPGAALKVAWGAGFFVFFAVDYGVLLDWETPFACLTIYLAALYLLQDRRDGPYYVVAGALLCLLAFVALTKHTSFVLASFAVLCVAANKVRRRETVAGGLMAVAFPLFLLLHWALAHQALANFAPFVAGIIRFSSGYNEAMMLKEGPLVTALALLIVGLLLMGSLANCVGARQPWSRGLIEASFLYILWKQGFVRADYYHIAVFLLAVLLLVVPFLFALLPTPAPAGTGNAARLWGSVPRWALPLIAGVIFCLFFLINPHCACRPARVLATLNHNLSWLCFPRENTARMQRQLQTVQQQCVLPGTKALVKGARIDLFGSEPGLVLLNGLNYWSRPMPITFAASNRFLQEANARFYRDPKVAPHYVLCAFHAINSRCPFQDDALALRALLDNYHLVSSEAGLPLLEQNAASNRRPATRKLMVEATTGFDQTISLASLGNPMIWMEATIEPSWLGRIRSLLYQPASCWLGFHIAGNPNPQWRRYVTALGPTGGMISPWIEDNTDLARLFTGPGAGTELKKVEDFSFACPAGEKKYFQKEIRIRLYSVPGAAQPEQKE